VSRILKKRKKTDGEEGISRSDSEQLPRCLLRSWGYRLERELGWFEGLREESAIKSHTEGKSSEEERIDLYGLRGSGDVGTERSKTQTLDKVMERKAFALSDTDTGQVRDTARSEKVEKRRSGRRVSPRGTSGREKPLARVDKQERQRAYEKGKRKSAERTRGNRRPTKVGRAPRANAGAGTRRGRSLSKKKVWERGDSRRQANPERLRRAASQR